jgi:hypothetical protein
VTGAVAIVGVHIAADTVWLAPIAVDGALVIGDDDRLQLYSPALPLTRALSEFEQSFEEILDRCQPNVLALLKPGASQRKPAPSDSRRRGWLESAMMIAGHRSGIEIAEVTHEKVAKCLGVRPTDPSFVSRAAERLPSGPPQRWKERAPAYGAAVAVLPENE